MIEVIPAKVKEILAETRRELEDVYHRQMQSLILFGSYARGDFHEDSDIDLILILEKMTDPSAERDRYLPIISRICLKYDTVISVVPFTADQFAQVRTPLVLNVQREGMQL